MICISKSFLSQKSDKRTLIVFEEPISCLIVCLIVFRLFFISFCSTFFQETEQSLSWRRPIFSNRMLPDCLCVVSQCKTYGSNTCAISSPTLQQKVAKGQELEIHRITIWVFSHRSTGFEGCGGMQRAKAKQICFPQGLRMNGLPSCAFV